MTEVWGEKSEGMKTFLKSIVPFDPTTGVCATCGVPVSESDFGDELSRKEYTISGMCQKCQDSVFDSDDDNDDDDDYTETKLDQWVDSGAW